MLVFNIVIGFLWDIYVKTYRKHMNLAATGLIDQTDKAVLGILKLGQMAEDLGRQRTIKGKYKKEVRGGDRRRKEDTKE